MADKRSMAELKMEIEKFRIGTLAGLFGDEAKQRARALVERLDQRAEIEEPQPETRTFPPQLVRPGVFPIKARIVKLQAFENDPDVVDDALLQFKKDYDNDDLAYAGRLVDTVVAGTVTAIGLCTQVNDWLSDAEEKDILDWELSQDAMTGYPRLLILYTE